MKPKILVFSGYGLNCEEETKFAFDTAGGDARIVHINDLISGNHKLLDYQALAFPGGFAYGDDTGSGNAYAARLKNHLWEKLLKFVHKDKLIIGICNGFQILVNLGFLPAFGGNYGKKEVALLHNTTTRYTVRWVDLKIISTGPWVTGISELSLPIAHGEGRFYASTKILKSLNKKNLICARYIRGDICEKQKLVPNPNGSLEGIAAITDESKRILGIMPHPERALLFTHHPLWTLVKEKYQREGKKLPRFGPSLKIFQNAVKYFR